MPESPSNDMGVREDPTHINTPADKNVASLRWSLEALLIELELEELLDDDLQDPDSQA